MTRGQWLISLLIAGHMAAVFVGAVPNLDDFGMLDDRLAEPPLLKVAAALDAASVRLTWLHRATFSATAPLRRLSSAYLGITGQSEQWSMFCNPSRVQQQVRMGYRVRRADGSSTTEYEAVFPVGAPDQWKILRSYVNAFEDKPFTSVAGTYRKQQARARSNGIATPTPQMLSTLKPLTRYYGRRRLAAGLPRDASLVAVEYWYGVTPIPAPPGGGDSQMVRAARPVLETSWQRPGASVGAWHLRPWLNAHGLGSVFGLGLRWLLLIGYAWLALGIGTSVIAPAMFLGSAAMLWWNWFPYSSAQELLHLLIVPLIFVNSGAVWSVDARRRAQSAPAVQAFEPIWPLRLLQYQVAILYLSAALWKMGNPDWRGGLALHYVLNTAIYQRMPGVVPSALFGVTVGLTYLTLAWELAFPFLIWFRWTRPLMLIIGVCLHLGMWASMEVGAFIPTMLVAYVAFLDPWRTEARVRRLFGFRGAGKGDCPQPGVSVPF